MAKKPVKKSAKPKAAEAPEEDVIDDGEEAFEKATRNLKGGEDLGGGQADSLGEIPRGGSAEMPLEGGEGEKPVEPMFLKHLVSELTRLDLEASQIGATRKALWADAKSRGYAIGVLRKAVASLDRKPEDVSDEETLFSIYRKAMLS